MGLSNSCCFCLLQPWLDHQLGISINSADADPVSVYSTPPRQQDQYGLWAVRVGEKGVITTRSEWLNPLKRSIADLSVDQLFSIFGAYELSRITLSDRIGVWGPSWVLVGDSGSFQPLNDERPVQLEADEIAQHADPDLFWHCFPDQPMAGFAIFEAGQLVALASVSPVSDDMWEIGMDVIPEAKERGLGRVVVSASRTMDTCAQSTDLRYYRSLEYPLRAFAPFCRAEIRGQYNDRYCQSVSCPSTTFRPSTRRNRDLQLLSKLGDEQGNSLCR